MYAATMLYMQIIIIYHIYAHTIVYVYADNGKLYSYTE